jgi:curved DNA-binding protein CbpA
MQREAFETLGIEPTIDGRAIRAAFVRIARIYHPDRFADQPPDVRKEAERRMKEASAAYELLRASNKAIQSGQTILNDKDIQERARKYREAMEVRRREEERNRARWLRWEAIEKEARERAEAESALAAAAMREGEVYTQPAPVARATHTRRAGDVKRLESKTPSAGLQQRIDAARKFEAAKKAEAEAARKRSEEEALANKRR